MKNTMTAPVFVKVNRGKQKNKVKTRFLSLTDLDLYEEEGEIRTASKIKQVKIK